MRTHRLSLLGAVVVVAAAVAGGCGGSKHKAASTTPASSGGSVVKTVTVHEKEYKLTPSSIALAKPGTYIIKNVNDGTTAHAIAVEGHGVDMDGPHISPGSSGMLKVTLSKKGTYEMYCPVDGHKGLGMKGTITVGGSGNAGGGTSTGNTNTGTSGTTTYSTGY